MDLFSKISLAFSHGGIWMWPILIIQIFTIAIAVERFVALFIKRGVNQSQMANTFEEGIRKGELKSLVEKVSAISNMAIARATLAGAKAAQMLGGKDEIQGKMDEVLVHENTSLEKRIGFLSMLGNVATLTGLLGTITGMIKSFAAVSYASPADKAALLSQGISEAMNCTAYGLIVAIPALVLFAILQNRANELAEDLNQAGLKVFNWLSYAYEPAGFQSLRGNRERGAGPTLDA